MSVGGAIRGLLVVVGLMAAGWLEAPRAEGATADGVVAPRAATADAAFCRRYPARWTTLTRQLTAARAARAGATTRAGRAAATRRAAKVTAARRALDERLRTACPSAAGACARHARRLASLADRVARARAARARATTPAARAAAARTVASLRRLERRASARTAAVCRAGVARAGRAPDAPGHSGTGAPGGFPRDDTATGPGSDVPRPALAARRPVGGASGVSVGASVVATFSGPMDPATLTAASFRLAPASGGPAVDAAITSSSDGTVFTLNPRLPLVPDRAYTVTVTAAACGSDGTPLARAERWSFTTSTSPSATETEIATGEILGPPFEARKFYVRSAGGPWQPTYAAGLPAARGKLMNVRAANAIFDDENRIDDDPAANTAEFIRHLDEYRARGVMAFTVSLQGGFPGYEGALASAFRPDGTLKQAWLDRAAQVIEAADARGQIVILTLFYQRQDEVLAGDEAVRTAVRNAADWLIAQGYRNVIVEIANEYDSPLYNQPLIERNLAVDGVAELITLAKGRFAGLDYRLPVSVSTRDLDFSGPLREAADLALIHGNLTGPAEDGAAVAALVADATVHGPVVMNEDFNGFDATRFSLDRSRETATNVFEAGGSWGLMWQRYNQNWPFHWALGRSSDISGGSRANYLRAILDHVAGLTAPDHAAPAVAERLPAAGATGVSTSASVVVLLSEAVDPATVSPASLRLTRAGIPVPATVAVAADGHRLWLTPAAPLAGGAAHEVTLAGSMADAAGNALRAEAWSFTTGPSPGPGLGAALPLDGRIVVEAEAAPRRISRSGHTWLDATAAVGAVGGAVRAGPDTGVFVPEDPRASAPELGFDVLVPAAGSYRVWVRGLAPADSDDTLDVGLDGQAPDASGAARITLAPLGEWAWAGAGAGAPAARVTVPTAGRHTVEIYMREDGLYLDRLVLTADGAEILVGAGPAASLRE
jgi:hypothetical protein